MPLNPLNQGFWVILSIGEQSKSQLLKNLKSMEFSTNFRPLQIGPAAVAQSVAPAPGTAQELHGVSGRTSPGTDTR